MDLQRNLEEGLKEGLETDIEGNFSWDRYLQ
jgi:hypothetical protein